MGTKRDAKPPPEDEAFPGQSPRWRDVPTDRESEKERRAHDREAPRRDVEGAIDRSSGEEDE